MMLVIFENLHSVESRRALYKLPQQGLGQSWLQMHFGRSISV